MRQPNEPSFVSIETILRKSDAVSRRDFIYLTGALAVVAGASGCSGPGIVVPDERSEFRALRTEDLLSVHFAFRNLRIVDAGRGPPRLMRIDDGADAFLAVRFPGQHLAEEVFDEAVADEEETRITPPVRSKIAQPTQLVFRVPPGLDFVELTLQSLLEWNLLEFQTPHSDDSNLAGNRSRIELPVGLALAPDPAARWLHAADPVAQNGRIELWHTRLASANPAASPTVSILAPGYAPELDWETALTEADRRSLIGKSAEARTLILSPMGGWLDVRGRWEAETATDLSRWEQVATAGQNQRVVVESQEGFLYPFGHRATVLSVTERKVEEAPARDGIHSTRVAVLRKRDFVVIKEPQVSYRSGEMALQTLTAQSIITPALQIADKTAAAFWIETSNGMPYPFRFAAKDWADGDLNLEAPAVFVQATADAAVAVKLYTDAAYGAHRQTGMRGQSAAVAAFEPRIQPDADGDDDPAERPRSAGDTTLGLLELAFAGPPADADDEGRRFRCRTESMLVRIPSLEPFLDEARNRGWFELIDPDADDNRGEVFATASQIEPQRIPMYFDRQADRAGGLAAPSFDVDGLSRIHGPVGNAELVRSGGALGGGNYFKAEHATLLGGFPLDGLLSTTGGGPSPAIPRIDFIIARKQPEEEQKPKPREEEPEDEPKKDPEAGDEPKPEPEKPAYWEIGLGLTWTVPLGAYGEGALVSFAPTLEDGKSTSKLEIAVKATKTLGQEDGSPSKKGETPAPEKGEAPAKKSPSGVNLSASGKITNFALVLNVSKTDTFGVGFEHITVKLGPPKPKKKEEEKRSPDEPANDTADGDEEKKKKKESAVSAEVDFEISGIEATGGLDFVRKVLAAAARLPEVPKLPKDETSTAYPAKMPGAGRADINVTLGPFEAPKFKLLQFNVSNVAVTLGIGLNFLPRSPDPSTPPTVPDNVFSVRVASPEKPLTLLAAPWGGIAHLGLNFTPKRITGFQFCLGVVNKTEFDFKIGKATCEGSLAASFTCWVEDGKDRHQLDLILKLNGQAKLWFVDIHLTLLAVGSWSDDLWSFYGEIVVRVQIAFFSIPARFTFRHEIAGSGRQDRSLMTEGPAGDEDELTETEWIAYRSAFARVA